MRLSCCKSSATRHNDKKGEGFFHIKYMSSELYYLNKKFLKTVKEKFIFSTRSGVRILMYCQVYCLDNTIILRGENTSSQTTWTFYFVTCEWVDTGFGDTSWNITLLSLQGWFYDWRLLSCILILHGITRFAELLGACL